MNITLQEASALAKRSERQILRWLAAGKITGIKDDTGHWMIDLASLQQITSLDSALLQQIAAARGLSLASLAARIDDLQRQIEEMRGSAITVPARRASAQRTDSDIKSELPFGWMSVEGFCKFHGLTISTVKKAIEREELFCHRGAWKYGRAIVKQALDPDMQAAVLARYGRASGAGNIASPDAFNAKSEGDTEGSESY